MKNYLALLALPLLFACSSNQQSAETTDGDEVVVTPTDTNGLSKVNFEDVAFAGRYEVYLNLKNSLVASNLKKAKTDALTLSKFVENVEGCENAAKISAKIAQANDIKTARVHFNNLNIEIIPMFKNASLTSGTIYVQHCPMANNGDGADWLSSEKKIQNPYYGDEMMECGRVAEEITSI